MVSIRYELEQKKDKKLITRLKHLFLRTYRAAALDTYQVKLRDEVLMEIEFLIDIFGSGEDAISSSRSKRTTFRSSSSQVDRVPEYEFPATPRQQVIKSTAVTNPYDKNTLNPNALNFTPSPVGNQTQVGGKTSTEQGGSLLDGDLIDFQQQGNISNTQLIGQGHPARDRTQQQVNNSNTGNRNQGVTTTDIENAIDRILTSKLETVMDQMFNKFKDLQGLGQQTSSPVRENQSEGRHRLQQNALLNHSVRFDSVPGPEVRDPPRPSVTRTEGTPFPRNQESHREWRQKPVPIEKWQIKYSADPKGPSVEEFLRKVETLAKNNRTLEHELLGQANFLFKPDSIAEEWYYTYSKKFTSWTIFKYMIKMRFGAPNTDKVTEKQIRERKQQHNETFVAFVGEIERLCQKLSKPLDDRYKLNIIIDNMKNSYRPHLAFINLDHINLEDLSSLCFDLDKACYYTYMQQRAKPLSINNIEEDSLDEDESEEELNAISAIKSKLRLKKKDQGEVTSKEETKQNNQAILCWNCRQFGHFWKDCTKQKQRFCYACGKMDVTTKTCPEKHRGSTVGEKNE